MSTTRRHIGPAQQYTLATLARLGDMPTRQLAARVGPHGSARYGQETVDRCIRAGLVSRHPVGCAMVCTLTDEGRALVAEGVLA